MFGGRLNPKSIWHTLFGNPYKKPVLWHPPILLDENDVEYQVLEAFEDEWHIRPISWMPDGSTQALPLRADVFNLQRAFEKGKTLEKARQVAETNRFVYRLQRADEAWARGDTDA